eukprot:3421986-Amphidinium_carterae.1
MSVNKITDNNGNGGQRYHLSLRQRSRQRRHFVLASCPKQPCARTSSASARSSYRCMFRASSLVLQARHFWPPCFAWVSGWVRRLVAGPSSRQSRVSIALMSPLLLDMPIANLHSLCGLLSICQCCAHRGREVPLISRLSHLLALNAMSELSARASCRRCRSGANLH